jgi:hypothetical protein
MMHDMVSDPVPRMNAHIYLGTGAGNKHHAGDRKDKTGCYPS